jgi:hypothetical protein
LSQKQTNRPEPKEVKETENEPSAYRKIFPITKACTKKYFNSILKKLANENSENAHVICDYINSCCKTPPFFLSIAMDELWILRYPVILWFPFDFITLVSIKTCIERGLYNCKVHDRSPGFALFYFCKLPLLNMCFIITSTWQKTQSAT